MKYYMQLEVEAEQFRPSEDKIPHGAMSDGRGDPRKDPRLSFFIRTDKGMVYLKDGDYIVRSPGQALPFVVAEKVFEDLYTPGE